MDSGGTAAVRPRHREAIAPAVDAAALRAEVEGLVPSHRLLSSGGFDVMLARAARFRWRSERSDGCGS